MRYRARHEGLLEEDFRAREATVATRNPSDYEGCVWGLVAEPMDAQRALVSRSDLQPTFSR